MDIIKDRRGRGIDISIYGAAGGPVTLTPAGLEAAIRVKHALPGKPVLWARAFEKIFGLAPVKMGLRLWNGKKIFFLVPDDTGNFISTIDDIILRDQYNAGVLRGRTLVDAGANIGVFSLYAYALGAKKIYAFEPVRETFEILRQNLALNRAGCKIEAVNIALGEKAGSAEIMYQTRGEGSAMIPCGGEVNRGVTYSGRRKVRIAPLDALIKGKIGFIKMDVEGYEKKVLLGAAGIIKKYKPVLSLSAYHRKNDKKELPRTVLRIRGDYKISLNTFAEHDFYCE